MKINLDEGYSYGIGFFETIHIYKNRALFLREHLERINSSLDKFAIDVLKLSEKEIFKYLEKNKSSKENEVLKIILSEKNRIFLKRDYTYTDEIYKKGFKLNIAGTRRNENSIFSYYKTLNYAENIYEKRKSIKLGYDEALFLNSKGNISEGAMTNIFFIKDDKIFTPDINSGLLNGIVRQWLIETCKVEEAEINYEDIYSFDEVFVTNSLLGIMPITSIEDICFRSKEKSLELLREYRNNILKTTLN